VNSDSAGGADEHVELHRERLALANRAMQALHARHVPVLRARSQPPRAPVRRAAEVAHACGARSSRAQAAHMSTSGDFAGVDAPVLTAGRSTPVRGASARAQEGWVEDRGRREGEG
jgi:hypothetical protein